MKPIRKKSSMKSYTTWFNENVPYQTLDTEGRTKRRRQNLAKGLTADGLMTLEEAHQRSNNHGKNQSRYK